MRRGGLFAWLPVATNYPWEGLQGAVVAAHILGPIGYDAGDGAIGRCSARPGSCHDRLDWVATGDDAWVPPLINRAYGTAFVPVQTSALGENMDWTDWLFRPRWRHADAHADTHPDTDANPDADTDACAHGDTRSVAHADSGSDADA